MTYIQIAIDGPSASGKSTIAKALAKANQYIYLDTGAMYRAITWYALDQGIALDDEAALTKALDKIEIYFINRGNQQRVLVDNHDVTDEIRSERVTSKVSQVSSLAAVRAKLVKRQQKIAEGANIVMDGRDIGTKVLPNADLKVFMTASAEERARRRLKENQEKYHSDQDFESLVQAIQARDEQDSNRAESPLRQAEDAIYLDSSELGIDQVIEKIQGLLDQKLVSR